MEVRLSSKASRIIEEMRRHPYRIVEQRERNAAFAELCEKGLILEVAGHFLLSEAGRGFVSIVIED